MSSEFYRLKRLPPYLFAEVNGMKAKARAAGEDIIDLGMGNPDSATPKHIVEKLIEAVQNPKTHRYSSSRGIPGLRRAIAAYYQRRFNVSIDPEKEAVVTLGSKEGLVNLAQAITEPGDVILVPSPTYPIHTYAFMIAGAAIRQVPFTPEHSEADLLAALERAVRHSVPKPLALVLCFPANPTARTCGLDFYGQVVEFAKRHGIYVISDLAYSELYFDGVAPPSILEVPGAKDVAIEIQSMSKTYSMAGWRMGYAVGNRKLIGALAHVKSYVDYGAFTPIQVAATAALNGPQECVADLRRMYRERREVLVKGLETAGWEVPSPAASMFAWAPLPAAFRHLGSNEFAKILLKEAKVAVSPGIGFGEYGEGYVRIAMVENVHRIRQAVRNIKAFFQASGVNTVQRLPSKKRAAREVSEPLKIAIAGLGTVGAGLVKLLTTQAALLEARCGRKLVITAVSARDRKKERGVNLSPFKWFDDPVELAKSADADAVVELIGGADGPAKALSEAAFTKKRHVVTANKAMLAHHGAALAAAAERQGVTIGYEAAVAGGIPIVKALREGLAGNKIARVYGILNGTCNYILTVMRESGKSFADVLADAQKKGYAEADPALDVDGIDTAHKLAVLASLAFGTAVDLDAVSVAGIRNVSPMDLEYAAELGFRIKLLAIGRRTAKGIEQRVHPCMIPAETALARVDGVFNAVMVDGDFAGNTVYVGRGAGETPTASAVASDLVDLARGARSPAFGVPASKLAKLVVSPMAEHRGRYYIRLMVRDQPGVIADVSAALRDEQVSLESMLQRGRSQTKAVPVVLTTHETLEAAMLRALDRIGSLQSVIEPPCMIRIEEL